MRRTKEVLTLECILTDSDKLQYSKEMSEAVSSKMRLEESLKSAQTQMKAEIAACEAKVNSFADKINTGKEYRAIECEIVYDFKKKQKKWKRLDTLKTVKQSVVSEDELQEEIGLPPKD